MATGFVVSEIGYEYNDEIYSGEDGGTPLQVYLNKDKAEDVINKLNLEKLLDCELGHYCYDLSDIVNDIDAFKAILKKYVKPGVDLQSIEDNEVENLFNEVKHQLNEYDKNKMMDIIGLRFYIVNEVDIDIDDSVLEKKVKPIRPSKKVLSSFK